MQKKVVEKESKTSILYGHLMQFSVKLKGWLYK